MNYIILMQIAYFDLMAVCETGDCYYFHMSYCWQNNHCFYDVMLQASYQALEMGWA